MGPVSRKAIRSRCVAHSVLFCSKKSLLPSHKGRGFIPGVREKMAAVLGELTKSRLTLPAGTSG